MFKKKILQYGLCAALALSMTISQPLSVLAAENNAEVSGTAAEYGEEDIQTDGENTETEAGGTVESGNETENQDNPAAGTDETGNTSNDTGTEGSQAETYEEDITLDNGETENALPNEAVEETADTGIDGISLYSAASDDINATDSNGYYTVPTQGAPEDLADGIYNLPFRLFAIPMVDTVPEAYETTQPYGNYKIAQASMGNMTYSTLDEKNMNHAVLTVKDGKAYVSVMWEESIGCMKFNWYESKEAYEEDKWNNIKGGSPTDLQPGELGGTDGKTDGAIYEYTEDYPYTSSGGTVYCDAITKMTFPLPSTENPVVYVQIRAAGMAGGDTPQNAFLGFYWSELKAVHQITLSDTENGIISIDSSTLTAEAGETMTVTYKADKGYDISEIKVNDGAVAVTSQGNGSYTFVMPDEDVTVTATFKELSGGEENPGGTDEEGGQDGTDEPEVTDEAVAAFNTLKEYVSNMDPDTYFLSSDIGMAVGYVSSYNSIWKALRNWISESENLIEANGGTIPDGERESFEQELQDWNKKLVSPEYFGEIYSLATSYQVERGRTYEIPVTFYDMTTETVTSPLGTDVEVHTAGNQNEDTKDMISSVTVKVGTRSTGQQEITVNYSFGEESSLTLGEALEAQKNVISFKTGSFKMYATYRNVYATLTTGEGETKQVVMSLDWEEAKDVTEGEVSVDKTLLKSYIQSIENCLEETYEGIAAAWRPYVTEEVVESGLYEEVKAICDGSAASSREVVQAEERLVQAYTKYKTVEEELQSFPVLASGKKAEDYTAGSYNTYTTYVSLVQHFIDVGGFMNCYYPLGYLFMEDGTDKAFTVEEQKIFGIIDPRTGEVFTNEEMPEVDPEVPSSLTQAVLWLMQEAKAIGAYDTSGTNNIMYQQYDRYFVLEEELVSIKELKAAIAEAEKYEGKEETYTTTSFKKLTDALAAARAVDMDSATKEEVAAALDDLNDAIENLTKRADKTALKAALDEAKEIVKQTDKYTEASLAIYQAAIDSAQSVYDQVNISQLQVDQAVSALKAAKDMLVEISADNLDVNDLSDGTYSVSVNLWHATQDQASMGDDALYHSAVLTVKDGKYTLRITGHTMTVSGQTGELDAFRIVPDGSEPKGDGSNYVTPEINKTDNGDYYVDIELEDTADGNKVADYYYGSIKVHTITSDGSLGYPMGTNWISNRLRVSWDTLSVLDVEANPAFSATDEATGITVTAPEGALPAGTKLEVTKVTDKELLETVNNALSSLATKNTPYQISLYVEKTDERTRSVERETVEPAGNMELTITFPVPDGYDSAKVGAYYIDADGNANELSGTKDGDTYTVVSGKIGTYAMVEKKTKGISYNITKKPQGTGSSNQNMSLKTNNGTTTLKNGVTGATKTVKTGDETGAAMGMFLVMMGASAAAFLAALRRKRVQD